LARTRNSKALHSGRFFAFGHCATAPSLDCLIDLLIKVVSYFFNTPEAAMTAISTETLANIQFRLHWEEHGVRHEDSFYAQNVNLWRDVFPAGLEKDILGMKEGESRQVDLQPGAHVPVRDMRKVMTVPRKAFKVPAEQSCIEPLQGRFYPQGVLHGLPGIYPQNTQPFRIINTGKDTLTIDLNHPLADVQAQLEITPLAVWPKQAEFGGQCKDWICAMTDGPGLKRKGTGARILGLTRR
jgi:FKBP-type peptidyl-prolyl cis-trans isomerase 2